MQVAWLDYLIIIFYFLVVFLIGAYFARDKKSSENYLLGGRNMGFITIGLACVMSVFSTVSIVMICGEIYNHGLTLFTGGIVGIFLAIPCYLMFVRFYFKLGSFTPYEYLEYRYDRTVRGVVALSAFYARIIYLATVLYATSIIFEASYGWSPVFSILLIGITGAGYTIMGGSKAVIWTDVFQFFVMIGSFAAVIWVLCSNIEGGAIGAIKTTFAAGHGVPEYSLASFYSLSPYVRLLFWLMVFNAAISAITSASSDQITIQRLLSTSSWKAGFKAQCVSSAFALMFTGVLLFIGILLFAYFQAHPDSSLDNNKGDAALFRFVQTCLPSPLPGLFIAGMLAAVMSTVAAGFNSMAAVWLKECHQKYINRNLSPEGEVRVSKQATFIIGAFAIMGALAMSLSGQFFKQSLVEVGTLFGILGGAVLPAFLFAVLSRRANSTLVWCITFFNFGEVLGYNAWYSLSRTARQAWLKDPLLPWGWAGKLEWYWVALPLAIGVLLCWPWLVTMWRKRILVRISAFLGLIFLGVALTAAVWFGYSNFYVTTEPLERSFAFGLPISFFGAFIILFFCPVQPREKYQGLTLFTLGQPVLALQPDAAPLAAESKE